MGLVVAVTVTAGMEMAGPKPSTVTAPAFSSSSAGVMICAATGLAAVTANNKASAPGLTTRSTSASRCPHAANATIFPLSHQNAAARARARSTAEC
ncbi:MAG: hypothetical protein Kilf2KO_07560 [Rhodospirillales bacterium]